MSLRAINQNLLPVLLALLRERHVTRAAQRLGLSQPAVSKALLQLRAILGDELLVRAGRGLVLTRRGEELLAPVTAICDELEQLWRAKTFDPASSQREFVIAGADYCAMLMAPALAEVLATRAPGVSMRFVDLDPRRLLEECTDVDFTMIPDFAVPQQMIDGGSVIPLFIDEFVAVVSKHHPLAAKDCLRPQDMAGLLGIVFGNDDAMLPNDLKGTMPDSVPGVRTLATVQQFLTLPLLAMLTGTLSVAPRRLVEKISAVVPLQIIEGVVPPRRLEMALAWPGRRDGDADHRWFRTLVAERLSDNRFR